MNSELLFFMTSSLDWTGCRGLDDYGHDCAVYVAFFGLERFNTAQQNAMFVPQFIMSIKSGFQVLLRWDFPSCSSELLLYQRAVEKQSSTGSDAPVYTYNNIRSYYAYYSIYTSAFIWILKAIHVFVLHLLTIRKLPAKTSVGYPTRHLH